MTSDMTARVLRLLSLLQDRREWAGEELADRLHVTTRTLRRDIDRLRDMGYPVHSTRGHGGGYRLASGTALPPLVLGDDEAVVVAVALRTAAGGLTGMEDSALQALAKLEQVLPRRLRGQVAALQTTLTGISWEDRGPRADPALLATLAGACRDHEIVTFDYTTRDGAAAPRRAEPCHLIASGDLWYLLAHDTDRDDWRLFRLDRMAAPPRQAAASRPAPSPAATPRRSWRSSSPPRPPATAPSPPSTPPPSTSAPAPTASAPASAPWTSAPAASTPPPTPSPVSHRSWRHWTPTTRSTRTPPSSTTSAPPPTACCAPWDEWPGSVGHG
ncbi:helix-turn-helix transcriptional regulator [Streptomyces sp. NPDC017940]|uniref:helix-turn-helix transcriptional regulator n=1 Tax=Streptomyces sp. NPDC017940 TaxID=3365017 RepID=UPI0037B60A20